MRLVGTMAGIALAMTSVAAVAEDAQPNDAQIAHIAHTAGQSTEISRDKGPKA
jgi:predicted outer membrane protein